MKCIDVKKKKSPFSPKRQFFDGFFEFFWTQATLLIIIQFHSNLRSRKVGCISFLGEKTKLVYLLYSRFYNCLFTIVKFFTKNDLKVVRTVKKLKFIF